MIPVSSQRASGRVRPSPPRRFPQPVRSPHRGSRAPPRTSRLAGDVQRLVNRDQFSPPSSTRRIAWPVLTPDSQWSAPNKRPVATSAGWMCRMRQCQKRSFVPRFDPNNTGSGYGGSSTVQPTLVPSQSDDTEANDCSSIHLISSNSPLVAEHAAYRPGQCRVDGE